MTTQANTQNTPRNPSRKPTSRSTIKRGVQNLIRMLQTSAEIGFENSQGYKFMILLTDRLIEGGMDIYVAQDLVTQMPINIRVPLEQDQLEELSGAYALSILDVYNTLRRANFDIKCISNMGRNFAVNIGV